MEQNGQTAQQQLVLEISDGMAAYCGRILQEAGVDVVRLVLRQERDGDRLTEAHFHAGKRTAAVDASDDADEPAAALFEQADAVVIDPDSSVGRAVAAQLAAAVARRPELVVLRLSAYGGKGPWAGRAWSDLTLLASGGVLGSCGYDSGQYAGLPVAPAGGQAVNMAGMLGALGLLAALVDARATGSGREIDLAAHHAIAVSTEMAVPYWSYQGAEVIRHTGRHAMPYESAPWQHRCADGRYLNALPLYIDDRRFQALVAWMDESGFETSLHDQKYERLADRAKVMHEVVGEIRRFAATRTSAEMFVEAQARQLPWAPVLTAVECAADPHFHKARRSFARVTTGATTVTRARMPFTHSGHEESR